MCSACGKCFGRKDKLKEHAQRMHKKPDEQQQQQQGEAADEGGEKVPVRKAQQVKKDI